MRKIVVTEFLSLDGVMENPAWTFPYWNDEIAQFKGAETDASDALLLGRVTYEGFAAAWPGRTDDVGADYMNSVTKHVVSSTLHTLEWNNSHLIALDAIAQLKQQPGQNILVYGSGMLVRWLMQRNLIDEWRLLVYPVVLGQGKRLFEAGSTAKLVLVEAQAFSSGVAALVYRPAP